MVGNDDLEDAPIFGGELPSHPFFKQQRVGFWSHGLKLEGPPSIVDGIIPRHPEVVILQQRKRRRIIARHPQLSPGPILPEVNLDRAVEHGFDDPRVAWGLGSIHGVTGSHAHMHSWTWLRSAQTIPCGVAQRKSLRLRPEPRNFQYNTLRHQSLDRFEHRTRDRA